MVDVGKELLCALDFTFLQGTFLQGEVSLPRRGRKPEELLIHDLERTFRLDSTQRGNGFSERERKEKPLPRRGRKPEGLEGAPQRLRRAEWLLVHDLEGTFRLDSN